MSMPNHSRPFRPEAFLARRRARLEGLLDRPLTPPPTTEMSPERRRFLREEAEELYWNERAWEKLTEEEDIEDGGLVEVTFPGFLAFIDGVLLREVRPDSPAPASPRPEVVEDVLVFLCTRCLELAGADDDDAPYERAMTLRLIDLVLYRLHELPVEEVDRLHLTWIEGEE